jgi:hypothetical protein
MSTTIARAQIAAVTRHPDASTTERHYAGEMLRGPVTLEVCALVRGAVERLLGVDQRQERSP